MPISVRLHYWAAHYVLRCVVGVVYRVRGSWGWGVVRYGYRVRRVWDERKYEEERRLSGGGRL